MTREIAVARAERHGWIKSNLFGNRIQTTLYRVDRNGRRYAITILRDGTAYGAHAQMGR